ncbi:hypothetical protein SAMD00024442_20_36 [Candidatus Symbiothrix dinenymphae]|nr:hypothetical protein SAMD00024442_20_36 [Candidatus Symbiothrix dinenymphae]
MAAMTIKEKLAIGMKCFALEDAGHPEEATRLWKENIPLSPHMAKWCKEMLGVETLLQMGFNLSEAETEYGEDWLRN